MMVRRAQAISLTPLIDVVFILLMFFMLTSSFVKEKQIILASTSSNSTAIKKEPKRLWLATDGSLSDQYENSVSPSTLKISKQDGPLILHPEENVSVQTIVTILTALKQLEVGEIILSSPYQANAKSPKTTQG